MKFSAAHFVAFEGFREPLHGTSLRDPSPMRSIGIEFVMARRSQLHSRCTNWLQAASGISCMLAGD